MIRVQLRLKPYKLETNNLIEVKATSVGLLLLYCGILFEESEGSKYDGFKTSTILFLMLINVMFVIEWLYYFLASLNYKNQNFELFVHLYGAVLCKNKLSINSKLSNNNETEVLKHKNDKEDINAENEVNLKRAKSEKSLKK